MLHFFKRNKLYSRFFFFFFFNDTATTEIYTLSLHDALPILISACRGISRRLWIWHPSRSRSEEHTSELQSRFDLVCRLLLEKKKNKVVPLFLENINKTATRYKVHKDRH